MKTLCLLALLSVFLALPMAAQQETTTGSYTMTVLPAALTLSPASGTLTNTILCSGIPCPFQIGQPFSTSITVSGGTAPYSGSLQSGALPVGLKISAAGSVITIAGTPTAVCSPSPCSFVILVTDSTAAPLVQKAVFPKAK